MAPSPAHPPTVTDTPPDLRAPPAPEDPARTPKPQPIDPPNTEPAIELPPDPDRRQTPEGA
ncbi:MAG: hypothetical protein LBJ40_09315 [Delftia acidovorans]|nr:hypothetical protein [Delftia acidovorans]